MKETNRFKLPDAFKFNIGWIDHEHDALVDTLNGWLDASDGKSIPDFEGKFRTFIDELKRHFKHEEALMWKTEYPGAEWHAGHHLQAIERTEHLLGRCRIRGFADEMDVGRCFESVIIDVARADMKFFAYLEGCGKLDALRAA